MKAVNLPTKPIRGTAQGVHVTLRTWSGELDFSIVPMDDFKMVLGMKFFNQVHAFPQPATNFLSIIDEGKSCMVLVKYAKSTKKVLSAMQFNKAFSNDPSFLSLSRSLTRQKIVKIHQAKSRHLYKKSLKIQRCHASEASKKAPTLMRDGL